MTGRDETLIALHLPCAPSASATVRDELSHHDELGWILGDVMLVASELVNNAVVHSGCGPQDHLQVRATRRAGRLTVSVRDPGFSGGSAGPGPRADRQIGGWRLQIVEVLSDRWGVERDDGHRVWAELNLTNGRDVPARV